MPSQLVVTRVLSIGLGCFSCYTSLPFCIGLGCCGAASATVPVYWTRLPRLGPASVFRRQARQFLRGLRLSLCIRTIMLIWRLRLSYRW